MVISVADAYRIDPATGQVDMDLFQQFADQQAIANQTVNPNSPTFDNSLALSAGQNYLAANPDVLANAQQRAQAEGLSSGDAYSNRLNEIAQEHYNAFGQNEGRAGFGNISINPGGIPSSPPNQNGLPGFAQPTFDTSQYDTAFQNALGNFNGLLDNYNSFFGDMLTNATNAQNQMPQYGGGFLPFATTLMPGGGNFQTTYNPFNTTTGSSFGGTFGSNSSFGNAIGSMPGQAANSAHRQWFTL